MVPFAFNYSEICDRSVFNLNDYLLLSYSKMIKEIKRSIGGLSSAPPYCTPTAAWKDPVNLVNFAILTEGPVGMVPRCN